MAVGFTGDDGVFDTIQSTLNNEIDFVRLQLLGDGSEFCEECGEEIPEERRRAMPNAVMCVPCKSAVDSKVHQRTFVNYRGSKDSQLR